MMNEARRKRPPARSSGRGITFNAVLLGLMSIFEVTFDMLSLVAALLGGIARDAGSASSTPGATTTPAVTSGQAQQIAPQIVTHRMPARRPAGITVIAILLGLLGIAEVGFGGLALVTSLLGRFVVPLSSPAVGAALGVYYLLLGLVKFFFVWGLLRLRRWAYWATVFIAAVSLLSSVLAFTQPASTGWALLADLLIPAVLLVYFAVDSNVRGAFHIGRT